MKVNIDYDEWYPVYDMDAEERSWGVKADVSREFYDDYKNCLTQFHWYQNRIADLHDEAKKKETLEKSKAGTSAIGF